MMECRFVIRRIFFQAWGLDMGFKGVLVGGICCYIGVVIAFILCDFVITVFHFSRLRYSRHSTC